MSKRRRLALAAVALGLVLASGAAQAALVDLGDGTVKDTTTNLIWLQDWNVNGQKTWAENLTFAGSGGWVLPGIDDYSILFAEVGDLTNPLLPFFNVRSLHYWSDTATEFSPDVFAWNFLPRNGFRRYEFNYGQMFAVAVRPDETASFVPEPATPALVAAALLCFAATRRRQPAASVA